MTLPGQLDQRAGAQAQLLPGLAGCLEMRAEGGGGAAAVQPGDDGDVPVRQLEGRVGADQPRIVPPGDLAGEDVGVNIARQLQGTVETRQIVGEDDHAGGGRNHDDAVRDLGDLGIRGRGVAGAEIDRSGDEAADALAAADRIVAEIDARIFLLVDLDPSLVERRREGGAGALQPQPGGVHGTRCADAGEGERDNQQDRLRGGGATDRHGVPPGL